MTTDLIKSVSIDNLLQQRDGVLSRMEQVTTLLREAGRIAGNACGCPAFEIVQHGDLHALRLPVGEDAQTIERLRAEIDAGGWHYLMQESGLWSLMDHTARRQWNDRIYKGDVPALTRDNIEATFVALHQSRADMFERGVIEVYRSMSWRYRTNTPIKFGKRIIVSGFCDHLGGAYGFRFCHRASDQLDDLLRVCHVLDGKPEPDHRNGVSYRAHAVEREGLQELEDEYLCLRWYKAGTAHITFKRPEIIERLNAILMKHYPDALAARI